MWIYGTVNDATTPSPIRRLPKLPTNCTIVGNSPWSAKASGVVLGHLHTNYPDTKSSPDPSGQASSTRAPDNAHRGPHTLELADPARPDVHTVPPHRSVVSVVLLVVLRMSLQRF